MSADCGCSTRTAEQWDALRAASKFVGARRQRYQQRLATILSREAGQTQSRLTDATAARLPYADICRSGRDQLFFVVNPGRCVQASSFFGVNAANNPFFPSHTGNEKVIRAAGAILKNLYVMYLDSPGNLHDGLVKEASAIPISAASRPISTNSDMPPEFIQGTTVRFVYRAVFHDR